MAVEYSVTLRAAFTLFGFPVGGIKFDYYFFTSVLSRAGMLIWNQLRKLTISGKTVVWLVLTFLALLVKQNIDQVALIITC